MFYNTVILLVMPVLAKAIDLYESGRKRPLNKTTELAIYVDAKTQLISNVQKFKSLKYSLK